MFRRIAMVAAACVVGLCGAERALAQSTHIGSHAAYHFDVKEPGMGGQAVLPVMPRLELYPSAAVFFVDRGSLWAVNADLRYRMPRSAYLGAGLNVARRSVNDVNDTQTGVNLLGGLESRRGYIHPFVEGRVILNGESAFQAMGGLNITLR